MSKQDKPFHFFCSSFANWTTDDDLYKCLKRQRAVDVDGMKKNYQVKFCNVWKVPGTNKGTKYDIDNYAPQVEGVEFITKVEW